MTEGKTVIVRSRKRGMSGRKGVASGKVSSAQEGSEVKRRTN